MSLNTQFFVIYLLPPTAWYSPLRSHSKLPLLAIWYIIRARQNCPYLGDCGGNLLKLLNVTHISTRETWVPKDPLTLQGSDWLVSGICGGLTRLEL